PPCPLILQVVDFSAEGTIPGPIQACPEGAGDRIIRGSSHFPAPRGTPGPPIRKRHGERLERRRPLAARTPPGRPGPGGWQEFFAGRDDWPALAPGCFGPGR